MHVRWQKINVNYHKHVTHFIHVRLARTSRWCRHAGRRKI